MLGKFITLFLFTQCVFAQLNGEFWWLNSKVSELNGKIIPPPQYDDLTEFDTDDTRILFNENINSMKRKIINNQNNMNQFKMRPSSTRSQKNKMGNRQDKIIFSELQDNNKFVWPSEDGNKNKNNVASNHRLSNNDQTTKKITTASTTQDQFGIKFPERDTFYVTEPSKTVTTTFSNTETTAPAFESTTEVIHNITDAIYFGNTENPELEKKRKSICTYIKKNECTNHKGFIYTSEFGKSLKIGPKDPTLICCVLPLPIKNNNENKPEKTNEDVVYFPGKISPYKRTKRSNDELRQRNVLLQHRRAQEHKTKLVPTEIVTTENEDPYWNIKNSFNPTKRLTKATNYDYKEDTVQEYADELPRPGLLGIYSDNGRKPNRWSVIKRDKSYGEDADYDDVDDSVTSFGYGTIDPRQGSTITKKRRKPIKVINKEENYNPESQIINFQSNPNFEVLQGFKLLNLVRNKNKILSKSTNEKFMETDDNEDQESIVSTSITSSETTDFKDHLQLFGDCGTTAIKRQKDSQIGDAEEGSHPWLVLVTPTNDQSDILCYGTLIHPRAAITAGDCVSEISLNNITVLAGLWKLNDKTSVKRRTPQVHLHPKFRPGSATNNLAILTWSRPFKICDDVQTACLAEPRQGKDCMLYGWGGFDQALRLRSRWQRATMRECSQMFSVSKANPSNTFCATVQSRGTVTWSRPFKICDDVQTACLAEPRQGKDCMLYGWGGFDQALRLRSRWQRATMRECSQMFSVSKANPSNTFCATVQSRGTVSGVGGPLICDVNGRDAVVGVAVSRDTDVLFLPAKEWAMQAQNFINED